MTDTVYRQFEADLDMVAYQRVHDFTEKGDWTHGDVEALIDTLVRNPREIRSMLFLLYSLGFNAGVQEKIGG
jgi:hypothetical protein